MSTTDLYESIVDFHFKSLQKMYFSEYIQRNGYVLLFSDLVQDSYYNYIAKTTRNLDEILAEARPMFEKRNRKVAVYITPASNLYGREHIIPDTFKKWAADAWMILDDATKTVQYEIPGDITVEPVGVAQRDEYVRIFHTSYAGDNPDDPYANLPEYYSQSLRRSFESSPPGYQTDYVWAKVNDQPAGVAAMLSNDKIAGIYGVGTIEKYRKHGVGTSLMAFLIRKAKEKQIETIMLQTESGSKTERWYLNMGFKTVFVATYYVES